jgi:cell division protein FtsZ
MDNSFLRQELRVSYMDLVIGLGGAGKNTLTQISPSLKAVGIETLFINNDVESLNSIAEDNKLIVGASDISLSRNSFDLPIKLALDTKLLGINNCYIICGLGGVSANAIPALANALQEYGAILHLIVFSPFSFEGPRVLTAGIQLKQIALRLEAVTGYKRIDLQCQNPTGHASDVSLLQLFEGISSQVELYIFRNLGSRRI